MNLHCRDKTVATDTIYSDTPSIDYGSPCYQFFVCTKSLVFDVYGIKTDKQFVNTLKYNICAWGEMIKLMSNLSQSKVNNCAHIIIQSLRINDWQSELHYHKHNFFSAAIRELIVLPMPVLDV